MPDENGTGAGTVPPPSRNALDNVRNVLGFLLAGFGAILSFLGVRSSEVTTVLRNDSLQASLIALILLVGVLAAVSAVATDSSRKISLPSVAAIAVVLIGAAALVVFAIPIEAAPFGISGIISLVVGCALVSAGIAALVRFRPFWVEGDAGQPAGSATSTGATVRSGGAHGQRRWPESALKWSVDFVDVLILAAVVLIAIAAYGAMRLETRSQLSFSAQVGASFAVNGSLATVSVDISATKIAQSNWVFVDVYAVPAKMNLAGKCSLLYKNFKIPSDDASCTTDPCLYFIQQRYASFLKAHCAVLLNGSVVPNATGNVDETLSVPFLAARYQDVDVRAEVCSLSFKRGCEGSPIGQNSRLDWVVPNASSKPG
jgi:hypothetical protein